MASCKTWSFYGARIHYNGLGLSDITMLCWNRAFQKPALSFIRSKSSFLIMEKQKASKTLDFNSASARIIFRERITVIITYFRLNPRNDRPWHRSLSCPNTNIRNTRSLWQKHCWLNSHPTHNTQLHSTISCKYYPVRNFLSLSYDCNYLFAFSKGT
jgi:hypothetical protein